MASYVETLKFCLEAYSDLFPNEESVLHHLFFVNGNGYRWKDGELTTGRSLDKDRVDAARQQRHFDAILKRSKDTLKLIEETQKLLGIKPKKPKKVKPKVKTGIHPLWEMSDICLIPEDVKPDWLEAAKKAIIYASTLEQTREDEKWIKYSLDKIDKIDKSRS